MGMHQPDLDGKNWLCAPRGTTQASQYSPRVTYFTQYFPALPVIATFLLYSSVSWVGTAHPFGGWLALTPCQIFYREGAHLHLSSPSHMPWKLCRDPVPYFPGALRWGPMGPSVLLLSTLAAAVAAMWLVLHPVAGHLHPVHPILCQARWSHSVTIYFFLGRQQALTLANIEFPSTAS